MFVHGNDVFDEPRIDGFFLEGKSKGLVELTGYMAGVLAVMYPVVGNQEVPLVMSPVMQTTGWRGMAPLDVSLHVFVDCVRHLHYEPVSDESFQVQEESQETSLENTLV